MGNTEDYDDIDSEFISRDVSIDGIVDIMIIIVLAFALAGASFCLGYAMSSRASLERAGVSMNRIENMVKNIQNEKVLK